MKRNSALVLGVVLVVALLAGSVVLQATNVLPNVVGKDILGAFSGTSALSVTGCLFNSDGTLVTGSCQTNGGGITPLAVVSSGGGGGSCTATAKGVGWGITATPSFSGTASSLTISGTETVSFSGTSVATIPVSYTVSNPTSGSTYSIKSLGADVSASTVISLTGCAAGTSPTFSMSAPLTLTITFTDGQTLSKTATATGSETTTITSTDAISSFSVSANGGTFS